MRLQLPIYLDNHSTTRCDPRVVHAMQPYFEVKYGNPASKHHRFGWEAEEAVAQARERIAAIISAEAREIVFTSGATESNNLALKGVAEAHQAKGKHLITVATEHRAVLDPCRHLERQGWQLTVLPVDRDGMVNVDRISAAIQRDTVLVSVMAANNEIGTLQPTVDIGRLCKERDVLFHVDAAQAVGKIPIDVDGMGIDLLSISAHKLYGPKGIGALYVRRRNPRVRLEPLLDGGGHERGLRSGTLPTPLIVGFAMACELCQAEMASAAKRLTELRDRLHQGLLERLPQVTLNGHPTQRLPNNLNLSFAGVRGDALLVALKDVAVSTGAACTSAEAGPSHVLKAIGLPDELADASLRFGLGRFTTAEEIEYVVAYVAEKVKALRALNPLWHATT